MPPAAVIIDPRGGCGSGIQGTLWAKIEDGAVFGPVRQVFAGGQAGEPALWTGPVIVEIVGAFPLEDDRLARAEVIALAWAISVEENAAGIKGIEAIERGWAAILVGFGWAGERDNV